jgi:glycogen operon protein
LADVASEFFTGALDKGTNRKDIAWFSLGGNEMSDDHWRDEEKRSITVFVEADPTKGLLLMLNSSAEETTFALPDSSWGETFRCIFDASKETSSYEPVIAAPSAKVQVPSHSVLVWLVSRTR